MSKPIRPSAISLTKTRPSVRSRGMTLRNEGPSSVPATMKPTTWGMLRRRNDWPTIDATTSVMPTSGQRVEVQAAGKLHSTLLGLSAQRQSSTHGGCGWSFSTGGAGRRTHGGALQVRATVCESEAIIHDDRPPPDGPKLTLARLTTVPIAPSNKNAGCPSPNIPRSAGVEPSGAISLQRLVNCPEFRFCGCQTSHTLPTRRRSRFERRLARLPPGRRHFARLAHMLEGLHLPDQFGHVPPHRRSHDFHRLDHAVGIDQ